MRLKRIEMRRLEGALFLIFNALFLFPLIYTMGAKNFLSTIFATAHDLLLNTCFFIMAITVLSGALGKLLIEFGVVRLIEILFAPLMRPLFNLPGVSCLGGIMTFFSDNPAIIALAKDKNFNRYFQKIQLLSLLNYSTAFGMGLIVMTFMIGKGHLHAAVIGVFGALVGSIISTRLMQSFIKNDFPLLEGPEHFEDVFDESEKIMSSTRGNYFERFLNALLDGGRNGVELGLAIIPGVLIISTFVMLMTYGPKDAQAGYQGLAYEGVPLLTKLGELFFVPFHFLFGFRSPELISFPITSLGSVGAALSLVPNFLEKNIAGSNELAVFTAMGMCWSGFLSTFSAMFDALGHRKLTGKAIVAHILGGVSAGIAAHFFYWLSTFISVP